MAEHFWKPEDIREEGEIAWFEHWGRDRNPYQEDDPRCALWLAGWEDTKTAIQEMIDAWEYEEAKDAK